MNVLLLSHLIDSNTPAYGGKRGLVDIHNYRTVESHGSCSHQLTLDNHIGTHIDLPAHFCRDGKSVQDYSAQHWYFDHPHLLTCDSTFPKDHIDSIPHDTDLILWKSGFESNRHLDSYWANQPIIPSSLASRLKQQCPHLRAFGFDLISLTSQMDKEEGRAAHLAFLCEHDIMIIEDMHLSDLSHSLSRVIIAPLLVRGLDGGPCTVFAETHED